MLVQKKIKITCMRSSEFCLPKPKPLGECGDFIEIYKGCLEKTSSHKCIYFSCYVAGYSLDSPHAQSTLKMHGMVRAETHRFSWVGGRLGRDVGGGRIERGGWAPFLSARLGWE